MLSDSKLRFFMSCVYSNLNGISLLYPSLPTGAAVSVTRSGTTGTWSNWFTLLPAAEIVGAPGDYFDIRAMEIISNLGNSELVYFEVSYDPSGGPIGINVFGRGYIFNAGTRRVAVKGQNFFAENQRKRTWVSHDVFIRINSDSVTGGNVDFKPIVWCSGYL